MDKSYRDLDVWKRSHQLVLDVYRCSGQLPESERFGLQSQMRRSAVSVTSNLAEGCGRYTYKDRVRFWIITRGSAVELDSQLLIAKDLGYLPVQEHEPLDASVQSVLQMRNGLIRTTRARI